MQRRYVPVGFFLILCLFLTNFSSRAFGTISGDRNAIPRTGAEFQALLDDENVKEIVLPGDDVTIRGNFILRRSISIRGASSATSLIIPDDPNQPVFRTSPISGFLDTPSYSITNLAFRAKKTSESELLRLENRGDIIMEGCLFEGCGDGREAITLAGTGEKQILKSTFRDLPAAVRIRRHSGEGHLFFEDNLMENVKVTVANGDNGTGIAVRRCNWKGANSLGIRLSSSRTGVDIDQKSLERMIEAKVIPLLRKNQNCHWALDPERFSLRRTFLDERMTMLSLIEKQNRPDEEPQEGDNPTLFGLIRKLNDIDDSKRSSNRKIYINAEKLDELAGNFHDVDELITFVRCNLNVYFAGFITKSDIQSILCLYYLAAVAPIDTRDTERILFRFDFPEELPSEERALPLKDGLSRIVKLKDGPELALDIIEKKFNFTGQSRPATAEEPPLASPRETLRDSVSDYYSWLDLQADLKREIETIQKYLYASFGHDQQFVTDTVRALHEYENLCQATSQYLRILLFDEPLSDIFLLQYARTMEEENIESRDLMNLVEDTIPYLAVAENMCVLKNTSDLRKRLLDLWQERLHSDDFRRANKMIGEGLAILGDEKKIQKFREVWY